MANPKSMLPHWDMDRVYPGVDSPEFETDYRRVCEAIEGLIAHFNARGITRRDAEGVDDQTIRTFEETLARLNEVLEQAATVASYLACLVAANSRDETAQAKRSEFQNQLVQLTHLNRRFVAWIGSLDVESLIARSPVAREYAFILRKAKVQAEHLMSPQEEELAAELDVTGSMAWTKLYHTFTSQITVSLELEGETRELPMSAVRNLAYERDRETRRRAYEAELAAWERSAVPIAAALNSLKGLVNTLTRRRGWESPLDAALFDNNLDRSILDAMMEAAHEAFPDFRRYLRAKAHGLGLKRLTWYDLFAPLDEESRSWSYEDAQAFILEQFNAYSDRLRQLAERAFRESWIDAEPRVAKSDGGFCTWIRKDESRILINYKPTFTQVSTLAHELGHAYHNFNLARRPFLQRDVPMPLAETASTFCETIIQKAGLAQADATEQLMILEASLRGACQVVVDITSRFLFEQNLFAKRRNRELGVSELNELMLEAQRATYGDALDPERLHPYMWAAKPHYYSAGFSYYNFPYMFGMLFGLGLYARYQDDPDRFRESYDDLLASTGMEHPVDLAARFGIDIRTPAFWRESLAVIRADIDQFEALIRKSQ